MSLPVRRTCSVCHQWFDSYDDLISCQKHSYGEKAISQSTTPKVSGNEEIARNIIKGLPPFSVDVNILFGLIKQALDAKDALYKEAMQKIMNTATEGCDELQEKISALTKENSSLRRLIAEGTLEEKVEYLGHKMCADLLDKVRNDWKKENDAITSQSSLLYSALQQVIHQKLFLCDCRRYHSRDFVDGEHLENCIVRIAQSAISHFNNPEGGK